MNTRQIKLTRIESNLHLIAHTNIKYTINEIIVNYKLNNNKKKTFYY